MGIQDGRAVASAGPRHQGADVRDVGRECEACGKKTRDGKPYCPNHYDLNPYVRALLSDMSRRPRAEILAEPGAPASARQVVPRARIVVPIEIQVGDRFWVGLVKARGIEQDRVPQASKGSRRILPDWAPTCRPFTRLLTARQSRLVILYLQEGRASEIPPGWLTERHHDLVAEARRFFGRRG